MILIRESWVITCLSGYSWTWNSRIWRWLSSPRTPVSRWAATRGTSECRSSRSFLTWFWSTQCSMRRWPAVLWRCYTCFSLQRWRWSLRGRRLRRRQRTHRRRALMRRIIRRIIVRLWLLRRSCLRKKMKTMMLMMALKSFILWRVRIWKVLEINQIPQGKRWGSVLDYNRTDSNLPTWLART